jgi:hypothetical protein
VLSAARSFGRAGPSFVYFFGSVAIRLPFINLRLERNQISGKLAAARALTGGGGGDGSGGNL